MLLLLLLLAVGCRGTCWLSCCACKLICWQHKRLDILQPARQQQASKQGCCLMHSW
jgi:hypothetical protein